MEERATQEREKLILIKGTDSKGAPQRKASVNHRLEALKVLTLALLREVEALGETPAADSERDVDLDEEVRRFESNLIRSALIRTGGRQRRAAHLLGMKVTTLNSKIKRYNIVSDEIVNIASALRLKVK